MIYDFMISGIVRCVAVFPFADCAVVNLSFKVAPTVQELPDDRSVR